MAKDFTIIKIEKDVADAVWFHCKLNNITGKDFVSNLLREKLADTIKQLEVFKQNGC